jgi:hypothetical protein
VQGLQDERVKFLFSGDASRSPTGRRSEAVDRGPQQSVVGVSDTRQAIQPLGHTFRCYIVTHRYMIVTLINAEDGRQRRDLSIPT